MAANVNPAGQAQYQKLKDACDTFLRDVEQTLAYAEYPKWVNGTIVHNADEEANLRSGGLPSQASPEARVAAEARATAEHEPQPEGLQNAPPAQARPSKPVTQ